MNVTTVPPLDIKDMDEAQEHDHEPVSPVRDSKRRAKIVCTIGPASSSEAVLRDLMRMGMDVARLNFSHGGYPDHAKRIELLRRVAEKEGHAAQQLNTLGMVRIATM